MKIGGKPAAIFPNALMQATRKKAKMMNRAPRPGFSISTLGPRAAGGEITVNESVQ